MFIRTCRGCFLVACISAVVATTVFGARPPRGAAKSVAAKHMRRQPPRTAVQGSAAAVRPQRLTVENPQVRRFGDQGGVTAGVPPGTNVYSNEIDPITAYYPPDANERMADDLQLVGGACDMVYYDLWVYGDDTSGATFDVHTALWNGDPCEAGSSVIPGTEADFTDIPNDRTVWALSVSFVDAPVSIPGAVYLAATFSIDGAGWITAEEAELGFTDNFWSENDSAAGCLLAQFAPPPLPPPHAGFWANINCQVGGDPTGACCTGEEFTTCFDTTEVGCSGNDQLFHADAACDNDPCLPVFKAYENDFLTGIFDVVGAETMWADDLTLVPGDSPCEVAAYDIAMVGTMGSPSFDLDTELWTNDDRGTPLDEEDDIPLAPITGTAWGFTGITADSFARTLLAGPFVGIILPEKVWVVFSTSSDEAGPLLSGMANIGSSRDAYAIFNDPGDLGVWTDNFWYGGFDPTNCPGGENCNPAGSFDIDVWCVGEEPWGACCNDAAGTCIDGVRQSQCDGRWAISVTCDSDPFTLPCGTNACCSFLGCSDTTRSICATFSGSVIPGLFCDDFNRICPRNECLGADGSCQEANGTQGCEDAFCCASVCADQRFEYCCTQGWDTGCAAEAGRQQCDPPAPPNDHCGDAEIISGTREFDFDNATATTDGPLHEACLDADEETHITEDVWYCWTAPCTDTVYVRTCGLTEVDTKIAVYDGCDTCPPGDAALLGCNDDFCGFELLGQQSQVAFNATHRQSYLIRIGTFPGAPGGTGGLSISCGLPDQAVCAPGAGVCCTDTDTPGCNDEFCCETVCACDPRCCEVEWTEDCGGIGRGVSGCGAELLCGTLCGGDCPPGEVTWLSPPDGVVDARQPHPPDDADQWLGIESFLVEAPAGAGVNECWDFCETAPMGLANDIREIIDNQDGSFTINLLRPISTLAVTTLTYRGGSAATGTFTSHPANVDGDGFANGLDILSIVKCVTGAIPCNQWQCDADHSGQCGPSDILRLIDILNGADQFIPFITSRLPLPGGICP